MAIIIIEIPKIFIFFVSLTSKKPCLVFSVSSKALKMSKKATYRIVPRSLCRLLYLDWGMLLQKQGKKDLQMQTMLRADGHEEGQIKEVGS